MAKSTKATKAVKATAKPKAEPKAETMVEKARRLIFGVAIEGDKTIGNLLTEMDVTSRDKQSTLARAI